MRGQRKRVNREGLTGNRGFESLGEERLGSTERAQGENGRKEGKKRITRRNLPRKDRGGDSLITVRGKKGGRESCRTWEEEAKRVTPKGGK